MKWFAFMVCAGFGIARLTGHAAESASARPDGGHFESLGTPVRKGGLMGCIVGPDGQGGEALYFNFNQLRGHLFLVQVNPETGAARQFNAPSGPGAWAFVAARDDNIYLGTWDGGLILRFNPKQAERGLEVAGKPSTTEDYLWQFDIGPDNSIYACTYPNAKLVRFAPGTGRMEDLGRMHPTEMYARSLATGPDGQVYVGVGTEKGDLVAFDPVTGRHRSILPDDLRVAKNSGTVEVSRRRDGQIYAEFGTNQMRLEHGRAIRVTSVPEKAPLKLRDGREVISFGRGTFSLKNPQTGEVTDRTFSYSAAGDYIFMVGAGPNHCVYGSTAMPLEIFRFDPGSKISEHLGSMPGGEVYSMLENDDKLYLCYYGGAIMNLYDPAKKFWKFGPGPDSNPISFGGIGDGHLRPRAMIRGPEGLIYVGSEPPYGELGGALGVWDPRQNRTIENFRNLVTNQSIASLAWEPRSGLIYGGSGNYGGGGTRATEKEAKFFAFDPKAKKKVFETTLVPGAVKYPATVAGPSGVITTAGSQLLVFDVNERRVVRTATLPGPQLDISLEQYGNGKVIGLTPKGVFVFNPENGALTHRADSPVPVNCGFALVNGAVYFGSRVELWRYVLPASILAQTDRTTP